MKPLSIIILLLFSFTIKGVSQTLAGSADVAAMISSAEMEMERGKITDAMRLFEQVLTIEPKNLKANIFMGNYYFLKGERMKEEAESDYKKIKSPTKIQHADYKNQLGVIYDTYYDKAKGYLENVIEQFSSVESKRTLEKILQIQKKVKL